MAWLARLLTISASAPLKYCWILTLAKLGRSETNLPLKESFFETKLVSYNVISLNLEEAYPLQLQLDQNLLGNLVYVGYVGFGILVLATALFCIFWTVFNRSAMVVQAAQPFFLLILLSGLIIFEEQIIIRGFFRNAVLKVQCTPPDMREHRSQLACSQRNT
jgi:hypothetical protein